MPGEILELRATGSDPDGDALTYGWSASSGRVVGSGATARWDSAGVQLGDVDVDVQVSDGRGGVATSSFRVAVRRGCETAVPSIDHGDMKQFPWPPPRPTFRYTLPAGLLIQSEADTLESVFQRIQKALQRGGFDQWSAYAIGDDGFAVAARMETIGDDGIPLPGSKRWLLRPPGQFSIAEILKALVTAERGRYRILVLLVTPRAVVFDAPALTPSVVTDLPSGGAGELSPQLKAVPVPPERGAEALIFEFARGAADDPVHLVDQGHSPLSALQHLVGAGLWRIEDLR
jgi:hypothetical protein